MTDGDWILSSNMDQDGSIGVIQLKHVGVGEFLHKDFKFITKETFDELKCTEVLPGDILISRMADPIARACIAPQLPFRCVTAVDVTILRVDDDVADASYIQFLCNSDVIKQQAEQATRGTTRARITRKELETLSIPLPPLPEQQRIAEVLSKADRLRRLRRTARDLSDTHLQSVFLEMFGDGKDTKKVTIQKLMQRKAILDMHDGNHGETHPRSSDFVSQGIPFLTARNVIDDQVYLNSAPRITLEKASELRIGWIKPDDVLLAHNATVGRVGIVPYFEGRVVIGTSLTYYRLDHDVLLPPYFAQMFRSQGFQSQLENTMKQTTRNQVPITRQRELLVPEPPPLPLQQQFAHTVHKFERLRVQQREAERQSEHLFQTLLHRAFQGEL